MKKIISFTLIVMLSVLINVRFACATTITYQAFKVQITGKGQPMLFIPGHTCSGKVWDETVAHYAKNYECHVFTLAGYAGVAPLNAPPYLDTYKQQIINYITGKKLKNVILVGHSIGGFLSLNIAAQLKTNLQKVIIVDALPFLAGSMNAAAPTGFNEDAAKTMFATLNKMDSVQLKRQQLMVAGSLCLDTTRLNQIADWGVHSDRKTMAYAMMEMMGNDLRQKIADIDIPVLVLAAYAPVKEYPMFTSQYVEATYKQQYAACKTATVVVSPKSKHFIMFDAPDWLFKQMDTFIAAARL